MALGGKSKTASKNLTSLYEKFTRLRKSYTVLFMADDLETEEKILVDSFSKKIFSSESLSRNDSVSFFPELGNHKDDLTSFLISSNKASKFSTSNSHASFKANLSPY